MKYFIAFMLFLFTNCLVPASISAATNPTNAAVNSTAFPARKLSFKQKLLLKLPMEEGKKWGKFQRNILIGLLLIFVGVVLMTVGASKSKAARQGASLYSLDGIGESFLGLCLTVLGLVLVVMNLIPWLISGFDGYCNGKSRQVKAVLNA
jgi:uncharacterized membrane protein